ncbi:helix-turn-helix domain-containing protein [Pseudomonas ovata]|uniref:helix-turn-helix domain-containing protein n=1 Tax=Pseudomonas ovata TaxID=1839709 RepID=UPI000D689D0F|nr:helix-turn-helix domain-containing protein [Pseudomonas ovata]
MNIPLQAQPSGTPPTYMNRIQTHDADEHARQLNGWRLYYDQLSHGRFEGGLDEFHSEKIQMIRDRSNQAMLKKGAGAQGTVAFCLTLQKHDDVYCSGHQIREPCLLVAQSDNMPQLRVPEIVDILLIAIDQASLQQTLEHQGSNLRITGFPKCYPVGHSPVWHQLKWLVNELTRASAGGHALEQKTVRSDISDTVIMHLIDLMTEDEGASLKPTARKQIVDRACEYAMSHLDEPFSILDLCNSLGTSRRKLQYCFQSAVGINAMTYFRTLRLNSVRRELQDSPSPPAIQAVAERWGFWHMGRFCGDYQTLFAERPSHTLRR